MPFVPFPLFSRFVPDLYRFVPDLFPICTETQLIYIKYLTNQDRRFWPSERAQNGRFFECASASLTAQRFLSDSCLFGCQRTTTFYPKSFAISAEKYSPQRRGERREEWCNACDVAWAVEFVLKLFLLFDLSAKSAKEPRSPRRNSAYIEDSIDPTFVYLTLAHLALKTTKRTLTESAGANTPIAAIHPPCFTFALL
jgi:hypothetical protein